MAKVILENISKEFGKVKAVDAVSLEIRDKEFYTLLGPSGCGKTTLLRLIAGLEEPTTGRIFIGDKDVTEVDPKDRDIAMVFQSYALYPHMNVFGNLAYPLKLRGVPKKEIEERVKETACLLRIDELLNRKPKQLSGGQQQRVALGRAIIRKPNVFLLDEPLSNLDAKLRIHMRAELIRLRKKLENTMIYVTHDQVEAMSMSDRIAVMNLGKVQQVDSPRTIFKSPKNVFVAGFIGSPPMNFIDGTLIAAGNRVHFRCNCFEQCVRNPLELGVKKLPKEKQVTLAIRPENVHIHLQEPENCLCRAEIYAVEPIGSATLVDLYIGENKIWKALAGIDFEARMGSKVWVSVDELEIHLFDENGESFP